MANGKKLDISNQIKLYHWLEEKMPIDIKQRKSKNIL